MKTADQRPTISVLILAHNEESMLANCLETVAWCDEVIVLDNGSSDATAAIAERAGARVISYQSDDFSKLRNELLKRAKTDWVFYLDADERVTPTLAREIMVQIETTDTQALSCQRQNMMYGKIFQAGGWQQDKVTRIFRRSSLKGWFGQVHESPEYEGQTYQLHTPLLHLTHRNTTDGLRKTIHWTAIEAELLYESGVPAVTLTTLIRKSVMEVIRRAVFKGGYKDGMEGWIEALVQGANRLFVYIQVWEKQRQPSLEKSYQQVETELAEAWRKDSLSGKS